MRPRGILDNNPFDWFFSLAVFPVDIPPRALSFWLLEMDGYSYAGYSEAGYTAVDCIHLRRHSKYGGWEGVAVVRVMDLYHYRQPRRRGLQSVHYSQ